MLGLNLVAHEVCFAKEPPMSLALQNTFPKFDERLRKSGCAANRVTTETIQINVGRQCNQVCRHCHVDAGPMRTETMDHRTAKRVIDLLANTPTAKTLDITGGAPELCTEFRYLVEGARGLGREVIDRCNLTILFEPRQEDLAQFLADHRVRIIASLPCYDRTNVDRQRGSGVYDKSMEALRLLNGLGYGKSETGLQLDLVFNPLGPSLPPPQANLESDYKTRLLEDHGIRFNRLLTITNLPIKRFREDLERNGKLEDYMNLLSDSFNPSAVSGLMCRSLVSVRWDGRLSDCDFNQMLDIPMNWNPATIWDVESFEHIGGQAIAFADHCYACAAGAGSSCGGAIVRN